MKNESIIQPFRKERGLPEVAILVLGFQNWKFLRSSLENLQVEKKNRLLSFHIWTIEKSFSCVGPVLGSPAAVVVFENLVAMGVKMVVAFGCAGSLQATLRIGDIFVPLGAISEEGTSPHYSPENQKPIVSPAGIQFLRSQLKKEGIAWQEGVIWTTDAPYREMVEKVKKYQAANIYAVDMEVSALFTVSKFRNIPLVSILVISDELFTLKWSPGFSHKEFLQEGKRIAQFLISLFLSQPKYPTLWNEFSD